MLYAENGACLMNENSYKNKDLNKKIRVVIADDSALMRRSIGDALRLCNDIEVVGIARNGQEALTLVHNLKPDVVTLDVEMPELDGLQALGYIMSEIPTPCVMLSAYTEEGSEQALKALEYGAVDFIKKPGGEISRDISSIENEIVEKVKLAATVPIAKLDLFLVKKAKDEAEVTKKPTPSNLVFVIGSSTGGIRALAKILPKLKADFSASILIVQHMPEGFTRGLSERLNWQANIAVVEADNDMEIKPGRAILAKAGFHMKVIEKPGGAKIILTKDPHVCGVRPSVDVTMESAAKVFGKDVIGIILTGMGCDGTEGAKKAKENGGLILAEDESTAIIYGMPKSVVDNELADKILPLDKIVYEMERIVASKAYE